MERRTYTQLWRSALMFVWLVTCLWAALHVQTASALTITVGQPFTIAKSEQYKTWGYWNHPALQKCANGNLLLGFSTGEDAFLATQLGTNLYRSVDGGTNWAPDQAFKRRTPMSPRVQASFLIYNCNSPFDGVGGGDKGGLSSFCNLADGTCVTYFYHTMRAETAEHFVDSMWTSPDGGTTWQGPTDVFLTVSNYTQDSLGRGQALWRRSVELANGKLVTVAHALFAGQTKARVIALGSSDKGRNWNYLATVAYDPNINTEGYTEPIICQNAQGSLICLMRTEGAMMQQSFSSDGGQTWTQPVQTPVEGVAPDMRLLSNGVLACSYGRPGNNIMFSADGTGSAWSNQTSIFNCSGTCTTGYTGIAEVSPGRLLFVFDAINFQDVPGAALANCIRGVFIDVVR